MPELITVLSSVFLEVGVVAFYVMIFGGHVYGWHAWQVQAFAPELSTITVVLYAKSVFDMLYIFLSLFRADLSTNTIHGLFRVPELLIVGFVVPAIVVISVINLVRAYRPLPAVPPLRLVWRANLYAIAACFATDPFAPYINHWAAQYGTL
jgi:hypothetical protein